MNEIERAIDELKQQLHNSEDCMINGTTCELAISALTEKLNGGWVKCEDGLPEVETEVEVSVKRVTDKGIYYLTTRGFYEDGNVWNEDSCYCWDDIGDVEYDEEKDDYTVPGGWWESPTYGGEIYIIDDFVMAWKPLPLPYQPIEEEE